MIYHIQTYCTYGYWPEDLSYGSGKPIIVACDMCGKIRIGSKNTYHALCTSCTQIKRFEDPDERKKVSEKNKKYWEDPEIRKEQSNKLKEYHNNPEIIKKSSEKWKKYWEDPEERKKQSKRLKKYYEDPEAHKITSEAVIKAYEDDPTIVQRISKSVKNSELHRIAQDKQIGGNDIVTHHYIYDFNNLDKYTIKITRSEHAVIHNKLRGAGLEVPHINILKED